LLKELNLTEGRCTGIPKIRMALKKNGSPPPIFKTDRNRTCFLTTILMHTDYSKASQKHHLKDTETSSVNQSNCPKIAQRIQV
jgi:ATP-dependent DNA helicase RecG